MRTTALTAIPMIGSVVTLGDPDDANEPEGVAEGNVEASSVTVLVNLVGAVCVTVVTWSNDDITTVTFRKVVTVEFSEVVKADNGVSVVCVDRLVVLVLVWLEVEDVGVNWM